MVRGILHQGMLFFLYLGLVTGCATVSKHQEGGQPPIIKEESKTAVQDEDESFDEVALGVQDSVEDEPEYAGITDQDSDSLAEQILKESENDPRLGRLHMPIEINKGVRKWIHFFAVKDKERFRRFLERGIYYRDFVEWELKKHGVPEDLYYLAMIESGYVPVASSRAKAVGVWQFMKSTGKLYGLKVDAMVDERRDAIRATRAAARHLRDLHDRYKSWYLAMAAYNAGPGRINGAIRKGKSRDFWTLVQRGVLPRETMNYVPKFLAATLIGRDPARFGFTDLKISKQPKLAQAMVPGRTRLDAVAAQVGIPGALLRKYNLHLKRGITPPVRRYGIWVPAHLVAKVEYNKSQRKIAMHVTDNKKVLRYRVRRGDTLHRVAQVYGVSLSQIKRDNGLRNFHVQVGQILKIRASGSES